MSSNERDILKNLLLKEELDVLNELKQKLLSEDQFTDEISKVLVVAIKRAQKNNTNFEKSLREPIKRGVIRAFSESRQSIIDALLPIMGQLIRRSVSNSIKQFVTDINRALENNFSIKNLRWRWQAKKAGITYPEMLFKKTIRYQVNELFLINRENGLLIEHVGIDEMMKDNDAISGMLTAIQDFIGDSLKSENADLQNIEISNMAIRISTGPKAYLASVVNGAPTERFKEKSQVLIENIHADFSDELLDETEYRNNEELSSYLREHLISKSLVNNSSDKKPGLNKWIIFIGALIVAVSYWGYNRKVEFNKVSLLVENTPGLYLQSIDRSGEGFVVKGLLDPLADITKLNEQGVLIVSKSYVSLEPSIIKRRIEKVLYQDEVNSISYKFENNKLYLDGESTQESLNQLLPKLKRVLGVDEVINKVEVDRSIELKNYFENVNGITLQFQNKKPILTGKLSFQTFNQTKLGALNTFPKQEIDFTQLYIIDSNEELIKEINNVELDKVELSTLGENNNPIEIVIKNLQSLSSRGSKISLEIIGQSDCNGNKSDNYSLLRAELVEKYLLNNSLKMTSLVPMIKSCSSFNLEPNNSSLKVAFKVRQKM